MSEGGERIILALDTQEPAVALRWARATRGVVGAYKVGLEYLHANGPEGVRALQADGVNRLFLDCKFSDIPNTVAGAIRAVAPLQPWLVNLHCMAGCAAMRAGARAAREAAEQLGAARPQVIGVTVLTSFDQASLARIGVAGSVEEQVLRLARLAQDAGLDGVVASPLEIAGVRAACGPEFLIVTPGVRPAGADVHDQKRIATPAAAVAAGADYLVIGRAITEAADPLLAARAIQAEIDGAA